eukprot:Nitzschia sp. Nitz4//scaffold322_size40381//14080//14814//NITZ4_007559-RA/size40381-processed-gene-0.20-mRNA-1//-1//CDS//3329547824//440//frame0
MDLGFGNHNQEVGSATARALLQGANAQEESLNAELAQYDKLLDDEDGLEALRQQRLAQMQKQHQQMQTWRDLGHGTYTDLAQGHDSRDVAKQFFEVSKTSPRVVVHFYRPSTRYCDVFHAHLEKLARKHFETKFVKVNVEDCDHQGGGASFLVERLGIVVMPTLVLIKDRQAFHHIRGFDELGGTPDFSEQALAYVLGSTHGVIDPKDGEEIPPEILESNRGVNAIRLRKGPRSRYYDDDNEFD